jgi:tRNA threonylcarbamoyladenosine biosynthesis protein TsaE
LPIKASPPFAAGGPPMMAADDCRRRLPWPRKPSKSGHRMIPTWKMDIPDMGDLIEIDMVLPDPAATESLAAALAREARRGDVILLSGDLGAGKTHFARAFINALASEPEEVPSPTFTLVQTYKVSGDREIWHFDLYRLKVPEEVYELGIEDAFAEGVSLIEWPDRLGGLKPREYLEIALSIAADGETRNAVLKATPQWAVRAEAAVKRRDASS